MKEESKLKFKMLCCVKICTVVSFFAVATSLSFSSRVSSADSFQSTIESNPLKPTTQNLALGLDHFNAHCAVCHGATGEADTQKGREVGAADLTSKEAQTKSDTELFNIISKGVPGTAMPAFAGTHSATEIWQTILLVRKLPTLSPDQRASLEQAVPPSARHRHDDQEMQHPGTEPEDHHNASDKEPPRKADQGQTANEHHETQHQQKTDHEMSQMGGEHAAHVANAMMSTITGGPFRSMTAIGSGTSLMPSSSPGYMWHWMKDDWMIMAHGNVVVGFNNQGGTRGVSKAESENWFMLMAERDAGPGRLMLRGMFSAEPWTAPPRGFPQLFQTGETFEGRPIIDAQHPHDLFMELSVGYTIKMSEQVALNFYGAPVGEPALGPVAFMHRWSASENPSAPLGHHWQDSTHITHGVITAGVTAWRFRIEGSVFHGAEPDENRKDIEMGKLDSWSGRIWYTPARDWSVQFSYGHLVDPEALEPGDLERMTASISHNRRWEDGNWATSLIWGRNHELHANSNSYLLESTVNFIDKNYLFSRIELVDKQGLLEENIFGRQGLDRVHSIGDAFEIGDRFEQFFRVGAFTFGGVRDLVANPKLRLGIGADVTLYHVPEGLRKIYESHPTSFQVFLRIRPGKIQH
jgi:mono/diheme cytochrome c family protein